MMVIDNKFNIGDLVYIKTDIDQRARLVTGITLRLFGMIYELSLSENVSNHFDFELSTERDFILATEG